MAVQAGFAADPTPSHGVSRRFEDSTPPDQGGHWFHPSRSAFRRPSGSGPAGLHTAAAVRGPPCAFVPLQRSDPRNPAPSRRVAAEADTDLPDDASCPGLFVPYDTLSERWIRSMAADPSAAACHVRGLATPFAACTIGPTGARSAGASLGLPLQGVLLDAVGTPLGAPALLTLPGCARSSRGRNGDRGRLQGLALASSSCCHRAPFGTRASMPSWGSPLQSFPPIRPGTRL
jgi:hypothetical protein